MSDWGSSQWDWQFSPIEGIYHYGLPTLALQSLVWHLVECLFSLPRWEDEMLAPYGLHQAGIGLVWHTEEISRIVTGNAEEGAAELLLFVEINRIFNIYHIGKEVCQHAE